MQGMVGRPGYSPIMTPSGFPHRVRLGQKTLGHVVVFGSPWQAPGGTRRERLHSPWRSLLHPDMMCLTKAGKGNRNQSLHLAPLSP